MGIRFACHVCNKKLNIKRELAGRRGVCPSCSAKFRIPLEDTEMSQPVETVRRVVVGQGASESYASTPDSASTPDAAPTPTMTDPQAIRLPDDEPEATWYVRPPNGGQYGPASSEVLKQWVAEGRVAATALLWRDGWPQWRDAEKVLPELAPQLPGGNGSPLGGSRSTTVVKSVPESSADGSAQAELVQRPPSRQRMMLIGILSALSILLIGVLVFVMNR